MRCGVCWVFVIALAVGVGVFLTWEHPKYRGIHPVIKVIDLVEHVMFYIAGAYHGTDRFERYLWEIMQIKIPSGSVGALGWDGVVSEDIELPSLWGRDKDSGYKVQARIYIPERLKSSETEEQLPVLVYYHGGGFVLLSNADFLYDIMARKFATEGNMIILSVNYRLAPEYKFPAALMDSYSAVHWVFNNFNHEYAKYFDRNKVVVAGDSAGSMLSMSVSLLARDRREINGNIAAQVLLYPGTYYNKTTESFIKYGDDAYMLPQGKFTAQWFHDQYFDYKTNHYKLCDEDDTDRDIDLLQPYELEYTSEGFPIVNQPYLNPWAAETLEQIPFTHMIAAEYDLLLDENILLVERLESFGVPTKLTIVPKTAHGFFVLPVLPETIETRALIIETLQEVFQGNTATHMG